MVAGGRCDPAAAPCERSRRATPVGRLAGWLGLVLLLSSGGCTDLKLAAYRDDALLRDYRYALGEQRHTVDGLTLVYQEFGQGETVVILPGLGTSIDFWQRNIPALAAQYHVIAVDPPGFGKSDKPDASYDLRWINAQLLKFLDAKQIDQFSVIGGSMGGHLGLLLARDHPERVERLVLMGAVGAWPNPGFILDASLRVLWNHWVVADYLRSNWPTIFREIFKHEDETTARLFRYQMAKRANAGVYAPEGRAASRALQSIVLHSVRDELDEITQPTLLIWGLEDSVHPPESALIMRQRVPDARYVIVADAAHEVMMDQPERFNALVLDFLAGGTAAIAENYTEHLEP